MNYVVGQTALSPNESFSESKASDKSGVVSDKVAEIKQQGCRICGQRHTGAFITLNKATSRVWWRALAETLTCGTTRLC